MRWAIAPIRTRRSTRPTVFPNLPVSQLPVSPTAAGSGHREAGSRRRSAGSENAHAGFLVVSHPAGNDREHRADRRICRIARISRTHRHRCERTFPGDLPGVSLSRDLSRHFPGRHRGHAGSRRNLLRSDRNQSQSRRSPTPGPISPKATVPITPCRWT